MTLRIGVDLGGTKIETVALAADGAERFRRRIDSPRGDYQATLDAIGSIVAAAEESCGEPGLVGIDVYLVETNQTATTGPGGFYQFTGLCAGTYTVQVLNPPPGMNPTTTTNRRPCT